MIKVALQTTGWLLAKTPEFLVAALTWLIARVLYFALTRRRRLLLSNLHHAFPDKPAAWHRAMARECIRRFTETAFLSLAMPFMPADRLKRMIVPAPSMRAAYATHRDSPHPLLMCPPHFAHWETQTVQPILLDHPFPECAAIFRPLDNPSADAWIKQTRERFGMRLLSRREGFQEAIRVLRRNGVVGILYDQNAGPNGALTLLFDRVCSTTDLPGMLAAKLNAVPYGIFPRYLGFWRVEVNYERVDFDGSAAGLTAALNIWLERLIRSDDNICASWLWGHQRWKNQDVPERRLRLELKRNNLETDLSARGLATMPRRTRLWIRLPNWLGDVVMALSLLRAIRASRPDAEITLLARPPFLPLLEQLAVADRLRPLPRQGFGYFAPFRAAREEFPDFYILFTHSLRGDLEAWLTGCRQRFGIIRRGRPRRLLTHSFTPPADFDESRVHQFKLWTDFLNHFGLAVAPDLTPFSGPAASPPSQISDLKSPIPPANAAGAIGLIAGSENTPAKRWPIPHWRALIAAHPDQRFVLIGTANDRPITDAIAAGFGVRVENLAGRTDLPGLVTKLRELRALVTNDTGGMHLANALGLPLIALFGPTNPLRTGPIFSGPTRILQPPNCPPTGGGNLNDLSPATVSSTLTELLKD